MAAGRLVFVGYMPAIDPDGVPYPDAKFTVFVNQTTTLAVVYADEALTTPLANPVLADSSGQFPPVWQDDGLLFSASISSQDQPLAKTIDNLAPSTSVGGSANKLDRDGGNPEPDFLTNVGAAPITAVEALEVEKASLTGDTFTGAVQVPNAWTIQDNTQNRANDYGKIVRPDVPLCIVQGTSATPITSDSYIRPLAYFERHVAGRLSQPTSTALIDDNLDSNWLLSPTLFIQTVLPTGGSNSITGLHSRVISDGIGTPPTATNPSQFPQVAMDISVNCINALVGTVHTNSPAGIKARPSWAANLEVRWETGLAPDNLVGAEVDIINSGGASNSPFPSAGNNFTGLWVQSASRGGTSGSPKPSTAALYVSSNVANTGWQSAIFARADFFAYGGYFQNLLSGSTATGVAVKGTSWNIGADLDSSFGVAGLRINNTASTTATGLAISGGGFNYGLSLSAPCTFGAFLIANTLNAGGANGIDVNIARNSSDALIVNFKAGGNTAFQATGSSTNPIAMRVNGSLRVISSATLSSLAGGNEVLYCI